MYETCKIHVREGLNKNINNLAKLGDGQDESPTVMVGESREQETW